MGQYQDFRWITERGLLFAAETLGIALADETVNHLIDHYDRLPAFPDAEPALRALAADGCDLVVFSNGSPRKIERSLANSGLGEHLRRWVSVDGARAFKPAPVAYQHAATTVAAPVDRLILVSCNAFDVVGANAAGLRTVWVNRSGNVFDTIGNAPDTTITDLGELASALRK